MTIPVRESTVDMDCFVADMIKRGPFNVQRPAELSKNHFEQLRSILARVLHMYHPYEDLAPWQPGPRVMDGVTLVELFKRRDFEAAESYLAIESGLLPALPHFDNLVSAHDDEAWSTAIPNMIPQAERAQQEPAEGSIPWM